MCDLDATGAPSTFRVILSDAALCSMSEVKKKEAKKEKRSGGRENATATDRSNTTACQSAALRNVDVADRIAPIIFVFVFQSACDESIYHVLSNLCIYVDLNSYSISVFSCIHVHKCAYTCMHKMEYIVRIRMRDSLIFRTF